jgi:glycosyltransferase involved in cell wall biosynthesis
MKIYYSHDIFTEQEYGGVSRYFVEIIEKLSHLDVDIEVISGIYFNRYLSQPNDVYKIRGTQISPNLFINKIALRCLNEAYQTFVLSDKNRSILHQTYYSPFSVQKHLQVVVTVYDMVHELFPKMFHRFNYTSYAKKKSCQRADRIIAISESTKKDLINIFDIPSEKIEVTYLGSNFFDKFSRINPYKHQAPYILFVGTRGLYKNFNKILEIFGRSSILSSSFNLICFGGGQFTKEEQNWISCYGLKNIVHYKSGSDSTLAQYYAGARALVYPSLYEGFGIPLLEAMGMNCPVICSKQSSLPEVASDAAIYFDPYNIDHIQFTLENVLFDDDALKDISGKGINRCKQFTWEKTAQKTLEVYKSIS